MSNTALITGASGGIGRELAILHAKAGGDLILVARSTQKLQELKTELEVAYGIKAHVMPADLSVSTQVVTLMEQIKEQDLQVDVLINNAGFGLLGEFSQRSLDDQLNMVDLNVRALTQLTHLCLPQMIARGSGQILQVSSSASFVPGPMMAVYYATKAYVTSFSLAIAEEVKEKGITVTTLCPGPVATNFFKTAGVQAQSVQQAANSPRKVAEAGYRAMLSGDLEVIDRLPLKLGIKAIVPFIPTSVILKASHRFMKQR
jgi:short-subunit dehydrogenase